MTEENVMPTAADKIKIYTDGSFPAETARTTAARLKAEVYENSLPSQGELALVFSEKGLILVRDGLSFQGDYAAMLPRLKHNNLSGELLIKAARIKDADHPLTAVDATAGMGEDSLLLAAAGFSVRLYEYNPVMAELLKDTLRRALSDPALAEIAGRMQVVCDDSVSALPALDLTPDVILLDPMFPGRTKSGLIRKKFQLIHGLEQPCANEKALLQAALAAHPHKIVIKRPLKGPYLADVRPSYSLKGKAIRYDCIVLPR